MRVLLPVVVAAILFTPARADADLMFFVSGGELSVSFGLISFHVSDDLRDASFDEIGSADLVSGPLLHVEFNEFSETTTYRYGPGILELSLSVQDRNGNDVFGTFSAATRPFSFDVCEGCDDLFGGGTADDFAIGLGAGRFDEPIAKALGISPDTLGGFMDFGLEAIDGGPDDTFRGGFDHRGYAVLEIGTVEVPEPGLLTLGVLASAGWVARRRRPYRG